MRTPAIAAVLLLACAHRELVSVGTFKLERESWQDLDDVGGLAVQERIEVVSVVEDEPDHAQQLRVSCGEKSRLFDRCRYHVLNAIAYAWGSQGSACPPNPE